MRSAFIIAIIICIVIFFISPKNTAITTKEKSTAIVKLLGREPIFTEKIRNVGLSLYHGTYLTFSYPTAATISTSEGAIKSSSQIEKFQFQENEPRYHFFVQVLNQPDVSG